jgi:hypothetical protein
MTTTNSSLLAYGKEMKINTQILHNFYFVYVLSFRYLAYTAAITFLNKKFWEELIFLLSLHK